MLRTAVVSVIATGAWLWCASGSGQELSDPNKAYNKGLDLAGQGKFQEAVDIWLDVVDRIDEKSRPAVCKALGLGYRRLNAKVEAWHWLTVYLKSTGKEDRDAAAYLERVEGDLLKDHVKVGIACVPKGSRLWLARGPEGPAYACPLTWWFKPGKAHVHVGKAGFSAKTAELDIRERGGDATYTVALETDKPAVAALPTASPAPTAVDDSHNPRNSETTVATEGPQPRQQDDTWKWAVLGGGAGLIVVGGVLHGIAGARNDTLHDDNPADVTDPGYADNKKKYNDGYSEDVLPLEVSAWSFYAIGAAGIAFAGSYLLFPEWFDSGSDGGTTVRVLSSVGWDGVALEVKF